MLGFGKRSARKLWGQDLHMDILSGSSTSIKTADQLSLTIASLLRRKLDFFMAMAELRPSGTPWNKFSRAKTFYHDRFKKFDHIILINLKYITKCFSSTEQSLS